MRVVFAGTPEFAVPPLRALLEAHDVVGVLTQPDRPAGRGRKLTASAVKQAALAAQVPIDQPVTLKTEEGRAMLQSWAPDVLVVVAYGLLLPKAALEVPRLGCLNIHASLLPRWRGAAPIQRAVLAGDFETGVAIMRMEEGLDTGPVYREQRVPIAAEATSASLHDELSLLGARALLDVLRQLESGSAQAIAQATAGITYARKIEKSEALIDWTETAAAIDAKVRAFDPTPIAETRHAGEQLRILRARPVDGASNAEPGTVLGVHDDALHVACGSGTLAVRVLQRPGRKAVSAREWAQSVQLEGLRFGGSV